MADRVAAVRTPISPDSLLEALVKAWASQLGSEPTRNQAAVLAAQVLLETGGNACIAYNVGNIKGSPAWGGDYTYFTTWERVPSSTAKAMIATETQHMLQPRVHLVSDDGHLAKVVITPDHPGCCFRAYPSLQCGVDDYFKVLHRTFSPAWPFVESADPIGFAKALHERGYYTASVADYTAGMVSRFDRLAEPIPDVGAVLAGLGYPDGVEGVKAFQAASGLVSDGVVGPMTRAKLRLVLGHPGATANG